MRRRAYLASAVSALTFSSGCLAGSNEITMNPADPDHTLTSTGLAPDPIEVPDREIDESRFEEYTTEGITVKMVPLDVAVYWYNTRKARYIDTRTTEQYEEVRIEGAAHSPAPEGKSDDPVDEFDKQDRIVTYCTCPHTLAGLRAARLLDDGYEGVYGLNPGFEPWVENDHQIAGINSDSPDVQNHEEDYSNVENED